MSLERYFRRLSAKHGGIREMVLVRDDALMNKRVRRESPRRKSDGCLKNIRPTFLPSLTDYIPPSPPSRVESQESLERRKDARKRNEAGKSQNGSKAMQSFYKEVAPKFPMRKGSQDDLYALRMAAPKFPSRRESQDDLYALVRKEKGGRKTMVSSGSSSSSSSRRSPGIYSKRKKRDLKKMLDEVTDVIGDVSCRHAGGSLEFPPPPKTAPNRLSSSLDFARSSSESPQLTRWK